MNKAGINELNVIAEDLLNLYSASQQALIEQGFMSLGISPEELRKDVTRCKRLIKKAHEKAMEG